MRLDLSPDDLLSTTRSVRKRLDLERPVERELLEECIELALQAPTGSNRQNWHWVVVEDRAKKEAIAALYRRSWDTYSAAIATGNWSEDDTRAQRAGAVKSSAQYLAEHFGEVPYMVIPCAWGRLPANADTTVQAGFWGSILPGAWSFMLAARARGLGSAWTTLHLPFERETAEILAIPYEKVTQAGLFPVAYTKGTDFKPAPRQPLRDVLHWDAW